MDNNSVDVKKDTYINIITSIVGMASSKVDGVASVSSEAGSLMNRIMARNHHSIEIDFTPSNQVVISMSINVYSNYSVPKLTAELQEIITEEVEKATFFKVKAVNVIVVGAVFAS